MRDCLKLVAGVYEEIPHLIDEERDMEMRRRIRKLTSDLHPHLMGLSPSITMRAEKNGK